MAELNWSDVQEQLVKDAVNKAFTDASVATRFLPRTGPVPGGTEVVRNERIQVVQPNDPETGQPTVRLNSFHGAVNLRLVNLSVNVELTSEQVSDDTLSNALSAFRRAATTLALEQDRLVFAGYGRGFFDENSRYVANDVDPQKGLADLPARYGFPTLAGPRNMWGQQVVRAVVAAMGRLEAGSHTAPFACVLGNDLYEAVHEPSPSLVLPVDRITPMLSGRGEDGAGLQRSSQIEPQTGIVVSLGGKAVDLVVGTPPTAQYLQRLSNARFLFRVYLRSALRIRDDANPPVAGFRVVPDPARYKAEGEKVRALSQ